MTVDIQPIPTGYAGCFFRSRLEARWAVFFDALNLRWEYEPDAYALPSGSYLPDFRLHLASGPVWFEVKPESAYHEERDKRWSDLATLTQTMVYVAFGMPQLKSDVVLGKQELSVELDDDIEANFPGNGWDHPYAFCFCRCGRLGLQFDGRSARICGERCYPNEDKAYNWSDPKLVRAYQRALSMRFEPQRDRGRR